MRSARRWYWLTTSLQAAVTASSWVWMVLYPQPCSARPDATIASAFMTRFMGALLSMGNARYTRRLPPTRRGSASIHRRVEDRLVLHREVSSRFFSCIHGDNV